MSSNIWCPLPWTHIGVKNNGALRLCSHSQSGNNKNTLLDNLTIDDIGSVDISNCSTLKQVRADMLAGNWPEQCRRCKMDSEAGHRSRNVWETERHADSFTQEYAESITLPDGTVTESNFQSFDLRIGNQCNLRCVMCFPGEATKWYKDYKDIIGEDTFSVDHRVYTLIPSEGDFNWIRAEEKVNKLISVSKHLNKIKFGGGEPLMIKHHKQLIQGLIDSGYAKNIELEYSSNVTVFPPDLFILWKEFKLIKICASIDSIGAANEAIRYPSTWHDVVTNLRMLDTTTDNIEVFTSTTISLLTLEHFANFMLWLDRQQFNKVNKNVFDLLATHPVYSPGYLNIAILSKDQQDRIFSLLRSKLSDSSMLSKIDYYENYCKLSELTETDILLYRQQFVDRFERFAKNQNQDWTKIFPEAYKWIQEWTA